MKDPFFGELQSRHRKLLDALGADVLVLPAGAAAGFNVATFRQNYNFQYMTGFPESDAFAVFDPTSESEPVALFIRENNQHQQIWDGFTMGVEQAKERYPADRIHHIDRLESVLAERFRGRQVFYQPVERHSGHDRMVKLLADQNATVLAEGNPFDVIKEMRVIKSPLELAEMRKAIAITSEAMHACMRAGTRHRHEYQFEAEFEYTCKMNGVRHFAFGSIVAAGAHATCQHYVENSGPVAPGDMVLLDAGATWNLYCADLTRTFPVSGKFSSIQRDLYQLVLDAEKAGVESVAPGKRLIDLHLHSAGVLVDGLKSLGLIKGDRDEWIEKNIYKEIWPGALCHSLGLDVHDGLPAGYTGPNADKTLKPGMVITVEPGFYSQNFNLSIPDEYRNIGIRIEDDVLVTEDGYENLSIATVKEVADVEAMVQSGA